jgi:hypothetical protein
VVEQNNELLMKNHQSHLTCSKPFLEMNETFVQKIKKNKDIDMKIINGKGEEITFKKQLIISLEYRDTMSLNKKREGFV